MKRILGRLYYTTLTAFCVLGLTGASATEGDVDLKIGIVQRFGDDPTQLLQLEPTKGDRLRLSFRNSSGEQTIVTEKPVKLEVVMQRIAKPAIEERIVLGIFRTFETAEDNANKWREMGIEVEIAQPERWQVWAKRNVYNTPLLRRLLLQSLRDGGKTNPFLDTQIVQQVPLVSWVADNKRYVLNSLQISSDKKLIQVNQGKKLDVKVVDSNQKNPDKKDTLKPDNARLFPGDLQLQPNAYGTYTLVNKVPVETYLRGVVPYEIGTTAPIAAMEAQAIIARTYALRNVRRFAVDNYELCADTHCQVYLGLKGVSASTDRAIAATRGMVLTYKNELVDALYSASTGGITASFSDVWNGDDRPYLRPVVDAASNIWNLSGQSLTDEKNFQAFIDRKKGFNESDWQLFRWRRESSLDDISKSLQKFLKVKKSPFAKFKELREMKVAERSASGRILKLDIDTEIGSFNLKKDEVRSAFAAPISTLFYLKPLSKNGSDLWGYAFVGGGMGHGVGLSQIGAQNLAKLGWSSAKILQFYYPDTQLQVLNSKINK